MRKGRLILLVGILAFVMSGCSTSYGRELGRLGGTLALANHTVVDVGESLDDLAAKGDIKAEVYNEWVDFVHDYKKGEKLAGATYRTLNADFKRNPDVEQWDALERTIEIIEALSKTVFDWYDQTLRASKGNIVIAPTRE